MSTFVACGSCGTTYWTDFDAEVVATVRGCGGCGRRTLEVVAERPADVPTRQILLTRRNEAVARAHRARARAESARARSNELVAELHERAARAQRATAAAHVAFERRLRARATSARP